MNKKETWFLLIVALGLYAFIVFFERHQPSSAERSLPPELFPGVEAHEITAIQLAFPSGGGTVHAEKTGGTWVLTQPRYPALQSGLDIFTRTLSELRRYDQIPPHDVLIQGAKAFGLEPPKVVITVQTLSNKYNLQVGSSTPLTNNVYVRVEQTGEVIITDGRLLETMPKSVDQWRSPMLVDLDQLEFNRVQIRSGPRLVELERNATNQQWHLSKPIPARADPDRVAALFQILRSARVTRFVADGASLDPERFGLQTPEVELGFSNGTNRVFTIEFGGSATNAPNQVFARRVNTTNIVTVEKSLADLLKLPYKNYHDPLLLSFSPPATDRITVRSMEVFTLQRQPDHTWMVMSPEPHRADPLLVNAFFTNLLRLQIVDFAKEVPTEADLRSGGLLDPTASFSVFEMLTNAAGRTTNIMATELVFGTNQVDTIFAKRSDETPIYVVPLAQMLSLPRRAFELRDRRIWDFNPTNVVSLTVSTQGQTKVLLRDPVKGWVSDPIQNAALEEAVFRLGQLEAVSWVSQGVSRLPPFGIQTNSLRLTMKIVLNGQERTHEVALGNLSPKGNVYAAVAFPGEKAPLVFEFPAILYHQLIELLPKL